MDASPEPSHQGNVCIEAASTFPLTKLPYEIQLLIAKESLISAKPVVVGNALRQPGQLDGLTAGAILRTCSAFNMEDLIRHFYENSVFEIVNCKWKNFFEQCNMKYIQRVDLQTHSIIDNWTRDMLWVVHNLQSLENLQVVGFRVDGRWDDVSTVGEYLLDPKLLRTLIRTMCRACKSVEVVQVLINHEQAEDMLPAWKRFLESILNPQLVWPDGLPEGRKQITSVVRCYHLI